MNYTVRWLRTAEAGLLAAWLRAANKEAVTGYAEQIDRILAHDPNEQGESRDGTIRLWFHRPICVLYQVDEARRTVIVGRVKWVGR
jgi:hypothetical protein